MSGAMRSSSSCSSNPASETGTTATSPGQWATAMRDSPVPSASTSQACRQRHGQRSRCCWPPQTRSACGPRASTLCSTSPTMRICVVHHRCGARAFQKNTGPCKGDGKRRCAQPRPHQTRRQHQQRRRHAQHAPAIAQQRQGRSIPALPPACAVLMANMAGSTSEPQRRRHTNNSTGTSQTQRGMSVVSDGFRLMAQSPQTTGGAVAHLTSLAGVKTEFDKGRPRRWTGSVSSNWQFATVAPRGST